MISLKFIPLSFINSNDEIIRQIRNTVVFAHLFETCEETTLSSYIETTQYGFTASALENGSHKMLRITDIHHSKVNWEAVPFCVCPDDEKYLLEDNDILVARTGGTTGKSFFVENPPSNAVFASYLIRIRLKKDVNIEFINAFLNSYCFWSQIVEMKAGSAQPNVNAEKLKVLIMPDCDLETQAKTVRLLKDENDSEFDDVRRRINFVETLFWNNNQITTEISRQLELVTQLRQAFLREAMQGKLVEQDYTDESAEVLLDKTKAEKEKFIAEKKIKRDKPLREIKAEEITFETPSNWVWCRLGDITLNSFYGPRFSNSDYVQDGIPTIRTTDMTDEGKIELKNTPRVSITNEAKLELYKVLDGDLLVTRSGSIGIMAVFRGDYLAIPSAYLIRFRFPQTILPEYVFSLLKSPLWQYLMGLSARATAQVNINATSLSNLPIVLPPLAEQKRIVEKLERLMTFCDELETNIRESKQQAESLLQVAFKEALESK